MNASEIRTFNTRFTLVACFVYSKMLFLQAAKSSDSEDGTETETGEEGEDGEKEKEEKEKEGEEKTEPPLEDDTKKHGFLILSREDSTMVKNTRTHVFIICFGVYNVDELIPWFCADPSDRSGDHGAGHQWFCHPGPHCVCWKYR